MLNLGDFDETPFVSALETCESAGIRFETLESLGDTAENRRNLYDLNKECSADIPARGDFYTLEEYIDFRFNRVAYDPKGVILALDQPSWVGLSISSNWDSKGFFFNEMTGVLPDYRRRGIATAMKLLGIRFAISCGVETIYTIHDLANDPAIQMNRQLGFVDTNWDKLD